MQIAFLAHMSDSSIMSVRFETLGCFSPLPVLVTGRVFRVRSIAGSVPATFSRSTVWSRGVLWNRVFRNFIFDSVGKEAWCEANEFGNAKLLHKLQDDIKAVQRRWCSRSEYVGQRCLHGRMHVDHARMHVAREAFPAQHTRAFTADRRSAISPLLCLKKTKARSPSELSATCAATSCARLATQDHPTVFNFTISCSNRRLV